MIRVTSTEQLFPLLPSKGVIALEGIDGAGKSTLARTIADEFAASWFELDAYIATRRGLENYSASICYQNLIDHISQDSSELKIIEGIFLSEVLSNAGLSWNISIFCDKVYLNDYGKRHSYTFDQWDIDSFPQAAALNAYLQKHRLPTASDIIYEWETQG